MNNSEKIMGLLSGLVKNGILTSKDVKKEILNDLKFRKDEVKSENIREKILNNSPSDNEDFFVVPKVVE